MGKKRKAKYFKGAAAKRRRQNPSKGPLPRGIRGIMFTTSASSGRRVADAEREALNLLEEYEDRIEEIEEEWNEKQKILNERLSKIKQVENPNSKQTYENKQQKEVKEEQTESETNTTEEDNKNISCKETKQKDSPSQENKTDSKQKESSSISDMINQELQEIRGQSLFRPMSTACKGVVFIAFSSDVRIPPSEYAKFIMKDLLAQNVPKTRYLCRMVPLDRTCQASLSDVVSTIKPMVQQYIEKGRIRKYGVVLKSRLNTSFPNRECIDKVSDIMPHYNLVDLNSPDVALNVQVLKTTAGVSVFDEFDSLAKMNLNVFRENLHNTPKTTVKDRDNDNNTSNNDDNNNTAHSDQQQQQIQEESENQTKVKIEDDKSIESNVKQEEKIEGEESEGNDDIRLF